MSNSIEDQRNAFNYPPGPNRLPPSEEHSQLPGWGKALAIIAIVLGGMNLLSGCCATFAVVAVPAWLNSPEFKQSLDNDPDLAEQIRVLQENQILFLAMSSVNAILGLLLVIGGFMTIYRKEAGRRLLVVGCIGMALASLIGNGISIAMAISANAPEAIISTIPQVLISVLALAFYIWCAIYFSGQVKRRFS